MVIVVEEFRVKPEYLGLKVHSSSINAFNDFVEKEKGKEITVYLLPSLNSGETLVLDEKAYSGRWLYLTHGGKDASPETRKAIYEGLKEFYDSQ